MYSGLGDRQRALEYYGQALPIRREVGDRAGEAVTLNNIGALYSRLGDRQRTLEVRAGVAESSGRSAYRAGEGAAVGRASAPCTWV